MIKLLRFSYLFWTLICKWSFPWLLLAIATKENFISHQKNCSWLWFVILNLVIKFGSDAATAVFEPLQWGKNMVFVAQCSKNWNKIAITNRLHNYTYLKIWNQWCFYAFKLSQNAILFSSNFLSIMGELAQQQRMELIIL